MANTGFDTTWLNQVTNEKFLPVFRNLAYNKPVAMNRLMARGRIQPLSGRGLAWVPGVTKHAPVGLTGGYDPMATQQARPTEKATLSPAKYFATLSISGDEERENSGSVEKLMDMLKIQTEMADSGIRDEMNTDFFASNTTRNGYKSIVGLGAIVAIDRSYAGIDSTTYTNWDGNVDSTAHTVKNLKDPAHTSYMPKILADSFVSCFEAPDLIVSNTAAWTLYCEIMQIQNLRFNNTRGDIGFNSVELMGAEYIYDKNCTAYYLYMLNTPSLTFYYYPDANFSLAQEGWTATTANGQDAKQAFIIWMGQLVCTAPKNNAVLSSVGAT